MRCARRTPRPARTGRPPAGRVGGTDPIAAVASLVAPLALLLLAAGCDRPPPPPPDVVAEVAGEPVRYGELEAYYSRQLGESGASLGSDVLSELFDQFVDERLLARLAVEQGLAGGAAVARPAGRRRAVDRLLAAGGDPAPTDAEIAAWYDRHRDELRRPERVRLRQLLVEDRATAERALAEIRAGADFAAVAGRVSGDPGVASLAGREDELSRDELPPVFADAVFELAAGEVSEPIEADYGVHLFQVTARLPEEVVPLADARGEIESALRREAADRRLAALVAEARGRYDVLVHERNLPFDYRGSYLEGP